MSQRRELIVLALSQGLAIAELARRFGVSRKTVYKWRRRYEQSGEAGLVDRSRRPHHSPHRTEASIEQAVLGLRDEQPSWGGRKLHHRLKRLGVAAPAPSTISRILRANDRIDPAESAQRHSWQRFEREQPNDLWQMDFKGPVPLAIGGSCHPLTVIDDHSRYALGIGVCVDQRRQTVQDQLTGLFERYGLPWAILCDHGVPWCTPGFSGLTRLAVWLMRLDVRLTHGRPYHPQTQGKDERFHRTMDVEVLQDRCFADHDHLQRVLDPWRQVYNHQRPHEALDYATPDERYRPSPRALPKTLAAVVYAASDQVRRVDASGLFRFHQRRVRAGKALAGESVALRPTTTDGLWAVYYSRFKIGQVDLTAVGPHEFVHVFGAGSGRSATSADTEHPDPL